MLNATPDSFSDGGRLLAGGLAGAVEAARTAVGGGAWLLPGAHTTVGCRGGACQHGELIVE